jgi:hypothetical protein
MYTLNYGMRMGGGIGEMIDLVKLEPKDRFFGESFYQIFFFVIINVIF